MPNVKALALKVWDKNIFISFFFWLPWQPEFFKEFKSLKYSESASPMDHFCEVLLKSVGRFQRRFLSNCSRTDRHTDGCQTDIDRSQYLTLSTLCSGELKTLWVKEKLLIMSNFSFSHSVFKRLLLQTCKNSRLVWERINLHHILAVIANLVLCSWKC